MVRCFAPPLRASPGSGWPGVIDTPGITAAAAAPGVAITVMPGVVTTPPVPGSRSTPHNERLRGRGEGPPKR